MERTKIVDGRAVRFIKSKRQLLHFLDANKDEEGLFLIRFDMPEEEKAVMHIIHADGEDKEKTAVIVACFFWNQTKSIRLAVKYGSNHESRSVPWNELWSILLEAVLSRQFKV
jgi:hypothetical protein